MVGANPIIPRVQEQVANSTYCIAETLVNRHPPTEFVDPPNKKILAPRNYRMEFMQFHQQIFGRRIIEFKTITRRIKPF